METRYRELEVTGTPREMGRQLGEAARQEIRGFVEMALEQVNRIASVAKAEAIDRCQQTLPFIRNYNPAHLEEIRGMAEGSGVAVLDLILLQIRNQFGASDSACTAFSLAPEITAGKGSIVAQNWDNDPDLDPFTLVLIRRPVGKPSHLNVTQAGLIGYIGFNDLGIGVCLNTLPAPSRTLGVPHYFTVRAILESSDLEEAVQAVSRARLAIPANILLATPQGPANLEVTIDDVHVLQDERRGFLAHTNHCLHPALQHHNQKFPELIQSGPRKARAEELLHRSHTQDAEHDSGPLGPHIRGCGDAYVFNLETQQWRRLPDVPRPVYGWDAAPYKDRYIIITGGIRDYPVEHPYQYKDRISEIRSPNFDVLVFDTLRETYRVLPSQILPYQAPAERLQELLENKGFDFSKGVYRLSAELSRVGNKLYLCGGEVVSPHNVTDEVVIGTILEE